MPAAFFASLLTRDRTSGRCFPMVSSANWPFLSVSANVPTSFVIGKVEEDVVVALFSGFLISPPGDLRFVPNVVVVGASLARLSPSGSQTGFPG
eukprot:3621809-Heterocapsa_arctica.AAC.1